MVSLFGFPFIRMVDLIGNWPHLPDHHNMVLATWPAVCLMMLVTGATPSVLAGTVAVLHVGHTIASELVVPLAGFPSPVPDTARAGPSSPARTVLCLSPQFWRQDPPSSF